MAITNASTLAEYASGISTQGATLTVDANNKRVGIGTTNPLAMLQVGTGVTVFGNAGIASFTSLKLSGETDSTSTTTGALTVTGGVGIGLSLTVGGDVSVGGTITYEDVTNVDSIGIVTARSGLRVVGGGITCVGVATFFSASIFKDDVTFTGASYNAFWDKSQNRLEFGDNAAVMLGTGEDLLLYANGSNSFIDHSGDGDLKIRSLGSAEKIEILAAGDVNIKTASGAKDSVICNDNEGVKLYYNNTYKFGTNNDGTDTTGIGTFTVGVAIDAEYSEANTDANDLVIGSSSDTNKGISIVGSTSAGVGMIYFTDGVSYKNQGRLAYYHADDSMRFNTSQTEAFRIDSSQRLLIGTTDVDPVSDGEVSKLIIKGTDSTASASFTRHSANAGGTGIFFGKSRNATIGSNTIVQDDDELGRITFSGDDGTNINTMGAKIASFVDGTPGENDMPGRLSFYTTADGAASPTERLRIDSAGNMGLGGTPIAPGHTTFHIHESASSQPSRLQMTTNGTGATASDGFTLSIDGSSSNVNLIQRESADMIVYTAGNEALRIDSSGRLLINRTTSRAIFGDSSFLQVERPSSGLLSLLRTSNDNGGAWLTVAKSRSAAGAVCQAADQIGGIAFVPHDGTDLNHSAASIRAYVDTGIGSNDTPGYLSFYTNSGTTTTSERLRITSGGSVRIGNPAGYSIWNALAQDVQVQLELRHTVGVDAGMAILEERGDSNGTNLILGKSRGGSGVGAITSGDSLGWIKFSGADGTRQHNAAAIFAYNSGTVATGRVAGNMSFYTAPDSAASITERMRILSTGDILIGNHLYDRGNKLQVETNTYDGIGVYRNSNDASTPLFSFGKSRGTSAGSVTSVNSGDLIGRVRFQGADGDEMADCAYIDAKVDDTPGNNDMPGRLIFSTAADGSSSPTSRVEINKDGLIYMNTNSYISPHGDTRWRVSTGRNVLSHNGTVTYTVTGMAYGFARLTFGYYGEGNWINYCIQLGGYNSSNAGTQLYSVTEIVDQNGHYHSGSAADVTVTQNNASCVIVASHTAPTGNTGTQNGAYLFESCTYSGHVTLTVS